MRLLFDENLSRRLSRELADVHPGSAHVEDLLPTGSPDRAVWDAARDGGYVLVTKDEDFHRLSILLGAPPKVVWIRLGNCPTADVAHLLRTHAEEIRRFVEHDDATFLALG